MTFATVGAAGILEVEVVWLPQQLSPYLAKDFNVQ